MGGYRPIDPILLAWAEARGLHVYTGHKQNDVRSMTIYLSLDRHAARIERPHLA